jgi:hypothetical protein
VKRSPIYLFYEVVASGPDGTAGDDGDTHYCCFHGARKICTIKRSMRSNLNGTVFHTAHRNSLPTLFSVLVNNLRVRVKPMYQLYCILKDREKPPTPDEIAVACGKRELDGQAEAEYLNKLEKSSGNIKKAFEDQKAHAAVSDVIS